MSPVANILRSTFKTSRWPQSKALECVWSTHDEELWQIKCFLNTDYFICDNLCFESHLVKPKLRKVMEYSLSEFPGGKWKTNRKALLQIKGSDCGNQGIWYILIHRNTRIWIHRGQRNPVFLAVFSYSQERQFFLFFLFWFCYFFAGGMGVLFLFCFNLRFEFCREDSCGFFVNVP